jgi:hypothetical protein
MGEKGALLTSLHLTGSIFGGMEAIRAVFPELRNGNLPRIQFSAKEYKAAWEAHRRKMAPILSELIGQPFATDTDMLDFIASEYHWMPDVYYRTPDVTICELLKSAVRRKRHQQSGGQADRKTGNSEEKKSVPREAGRLSRLARKIERETKKPGVRKIDVALEFNEMDRKKAENDLRTLRRYPHLF